MPLKVKNKNVAELIDKFLEIESDFPDHPARFLDLAESFRQGF